MMEIKGFVSDMDGTLIKFPNEPFQSSWDALGDLLSNKEEWYALRDFYYPKREFYREWFSKQVSLLKGLSVKIVEESLFPLPYSKGAKKFFSSLNGFKKGILSSGINVVAEKIASELGFDFIFCSYLEIEGGVFTGKGRESGDLWRKDLDLAKMAEKMGLSLEEIAYIGDHENDIPAFRVAGLSIAFNPKNEKVRKEADYVVEDFSELNKILNLK